MILEVLVATGLAILGFVAGMAIANHYHNTMNAAVKDALQRQFVRLQARADADDPCGPYISRTTKLTPIQPTGDYDGDENLGPIDQDFMNTLIEKGKAVTKIRRSDIAK